MNGDSTVMALNKAAPWRNYWEWWDQPRCFWQSNGGTAIKQDVRDSLSISAIQLQWCDVIPVKFVCTVCINLHLFLNQKVYKASICVVLQPFSPQDTTTPKYCNGENYWLPIVTWSVRCVPHMGIFVEPTWHPLKPFLSYSITVQGKKTDASPTKIVAIPKKYQYYHSIFHMFSLVWLLGSKSSTKILFVVNMAPNHIPHDSPRFPWHALQLVGVDPRLKCLRCYLPWKHWKRRWGNDMFQCMIYRILLDIYKNIYIYVLKNAYTYIYIYKYIIYMFIVIFFLVVYQLQLEAFVTVWFHNLFPTNKG